VRCSARARAALRAKQTRLAEARSRLVERSNHPKTIVPCVPGTSPGWVRPVKAARRRGSRFARVRASDKPENSLEKRRDVARVFSSFPVESAPPALPVPGGVYVARGEVLSGSRAPTCVSFGARDGVFSVWGRGGKPGERRFGMKTSSAHGARDRIRRPHPPGGCNHPRFCRNNVFLIFWRAGGGVRALGTGEAGGSVRLFGGDRRRPRSTSGTTRASGRSEDIIGQLL
jgi:hypothetical protein